VYKYLLYSLLILSPLFSFGQNDGWSDFMIAPNGDTVNALDGKGYKQGLWVHEQEKDKGEIGFYEYGEYIDDRKNGDWKRFSLDGLMIFKESFIDGNKYGEALYYDRGYLYCKGNYLALRSRYKYDTILVEIPDTEGEFKEVVVETNRGFVRHGPWTYYNAPSRDIERVETYSVDEIIEVKNYKSQRDSLYNRSKEALLPHISGKSSPNIPTATKKPAQLTDSPKVISTPSAQRRRR